MEAGLSGSSKKRRKKCDEEKPICRRCKQGGFVCDGYTSNATCTAKSGQETTCALPILVAKPAQRLILPKTPMIPGEAQESTFYVYFFTDTIRDLNISQCLSYEFWQKAFQVPSQSKPCIRHAVMALGATHWQYSAGGAHPSRLDLDEFILSHYNQAISQLVHKKESAAQESGVDLSTILTCCFLFVLLECLRGNFSEAVRHLESGTKLIANHHPNTYLPNRDMEDLAGMFHAVSSQVALFAPERVFPDIAHLMIPLKKYKTPTGRLRDLDEAEDVMNSFDDVVNHITWDLEQNWDDEEAECNIQWEALRQRVAEWQSQFEVVVDDLVEDGQVLASLEKIVNLRIQHKLWEILLDKETCSADTGEDCDAEIDPAVCSALLDDLEQLWIGPVRPRFGLKTDLIAALFQLYVYCADESVRCRIIQMLRSQKRREIVWDSGRLGDFLEADMARRALGLQKERWPDIGPSPCQEALLVIPRN